MPQTHRPRVVITGIGVVSPNGIGAVAYADACAAGRSGVSALRDIDEPHLKSWAAGQALNFDPLAVMDIVEARRVPRLVPMAIAAAREAMGMARLNLAPDDLQSQREIGVALGTGGAGMAFVEEQFRTWFTEGKGSLFSITAGTPGNLSSDLSIALRCRGPSHVLSTGCTSSTDAIGYAAMLIRCGVAPMMVAGGADSPISPCILTCFERMRVISTRRWDEPAKSSRPFDAERDGFILAEGAWMFLLEDREHALARGATIVAEVAGYASTCDAYHRVQIDPEITEPVRAIEMALADAGIARDEVGYINLHGTATQLNDIMETAVIHKCFGRRAGDIPASSTKSLIGHPQGACGAAGLAATVLCMNRGVLHPTINLDTPDPKCNLDYIPRTARAKQVDVALCNCIAFGSKNSALVVKTP